MAKHRDSKLGVQIGNVSGGVHNSIIAGRDVNHATIMVGGHPTPVDKQPTIAEFKQLLSEIQQELAEILSQNEEMKQVSPAVPFQIQGAEENVKDVAKKANEETKVTPEVAKTMQQRLTETIAMLNSILDGAGNLTEKAVKLGNAVKPIAKKLEPLLRKLSVAALWVAKLWLER
jgi:hypothetical protein